MAAQSAAAQPPDPSAASESRPDGKKGETARKSLSDELIFGPRLKAEGGVVFRLFAPDAACVRLALDEGAASSREPLAMRSCGEGWHELAREDAGAGTRYRFVLPNGTRVPDPASRFAPGGVHGPSEVIDLAAFAWSDAEWRGRPWREAVLYEVHIGAFTAEGTFRAAIERLDHLQKLGVTAVELMCVCAFAGQRSWGYDGVQIYAPEATYGRSQDLQAFVDAAHARGIMVVLDVVYNHFGPEGNYIPSYFAEIFSSVHQTAWGPALNFDGGHSREVREFIVQNALYWVNEFHMDGLRLDASHAMIDTGPRHILNEIAERVQAAAGARQVHLILESERRIGRLLKQDASGHTPYTAQWNHAVDHALGLAMSGGCGDEDEARRHETQELARALAEGFFSGDISRLPEESGTAPVTSFVSFIQTHDLVGNRVFGERIGALAQPEAVRAIAAIYLLLPQIPMLFMGEEWTATTPFPYFSDYGGELAGAVRQGRTEQMKRTSDVDDATLKRMPDPQAESTFLAAKLRWEELDAPDHAAQMNWYRGILEARRRHILPLLDALTEPCGSYEVRGPGRFECEWALRDGRRLHLEANLCAEASGGFSPARERESIWLEGSQADAQTLGAWTVRWSLD
jgi:malto-oligosyltrehalose trehalohydrolase